VAVSSRTSTEPGTPRGGPQHARADTPRRRQRHRLLQRVAEPAAVVLALLAIWQVLDDSGVLPQDTVPRPSAIAAKIVRDVQGHYFWFSLGQTLGAWGLGVGLVLLVAVPLGLVLGSSKLTYQATSPMLEFIRMVPSIAALPIVVVILGTGMKLTLIMVLLAATWPLLIQTLSGARDVDPVMLDTGRVYGFGTLRQFAKIIVPNALPYVATGLRLSAVMSLLAAISASMITYSAGLGEAIAQPAANGQIVLMYARIVLVGLVSLTVTMTLTTLERRTIRWHPSHRSDVGA
jgi:ABC-type nitrate/sulfonate/bicarbonate transport system permease component